MARALRRSMGLVVLGGLFTLAAPAAAETPRHPAKISIDDARTKALRLVPGTVSAEELEHEGGRWIYSFEIKPTGEKRAIIEEVNIDADTGALVGPIQTEKE